MELEEIKNRIFNISFIANGASEIFSLLSKVVVETTEGDQPLNSFSDSFLFFKYASEKMFDDLQDLYDCILEQQKQEKPEQKPYPKAYEQEKQKLINECKDLDASEFGKRLKRLAALYNL